MEEKYWKQFCSTGAVEDYLQYTSARVAQQGQTGTEPSARDGMENSHRTQDREKKRI